MKKRKNYGKHSQFFRKIRKPKGFYYHFNLNYCFIMVFDTLPFTVRITTMLSPFGSISTL